MRQARTLQFHSRCFSFALPALVLFIGAAVQGLPLRAQETPQGPLAPPPEHHVTRIGNTPEPEAPPSLPESEIIKRFAQKEDEDIVSRTRYTYRKTVRIQQFGRDGQASGQCVVVTEPARSVD